MALTIPTIPSMPAGSVATSTQMNDLAACCTFLLGKPFGRIRDAAGGGSVPHGTSSPVPMATVDVDTDSMTGALASAFTVSTPGWYKIRYTVSATSADIETYCKSITGTSNPLGSGVASIQVYGAVGRGSGSFVVCGARGIWPFYLYAGDYLQVYAGAGATSTTYSTNNEGSSFSVEYVSI